MNRALVEVARNSRSVAFQRMMVLRIMSYKSVDNFNVVNNHHQRQMRSLSQTFPYWQNLCTIREAEFLVLKAIYLCAAI